MLVYRSVARQGTILIIVAGLSALMASLALAFVIKVRSENEESRAIVNDVQARIMLVAALNYIQECSRIGWDRYPRIPTLGQFTRQPIDYRPNPPPLPTVKNDIFPGGGGGQTVAVHEETFGWIDVRDGSIGPKPLVNQTFDEFHGVRETIDWTGSLRRNWPAINGIARCPMFVHKRPPYATELTVCYNPINTNPAAQTNNDYLMPYLRNPDPRPLLSTDPDPAQRYADFATGDPNPLAHTVNKAWFRVLREGPSTFLITCGAGGTQGLRNYREAVNQGKADLFNNDPSYFNVLANQEVRMWYRVEWSASSAESTYHWQHHFTQIHNQLREDSYYQWPVNASSSYSDGRNRSPAFDRNMGGTFRWIMRLRDEPTDW